MRLDSEVTGLSATSPPECSRIVTQLFRSGNRIIRKTFQDSLLSELLSTRHFRASLLGGVRGWCLPVAFRPEPSHML